MYTLGRIDSATIFINYFEIAKKNFEACVSVTIQKAKKILQNSYTLRKDDKYLQILLCFIHIYTIGWSAINKKDNTHREM